MDISAMRIDDVHDVYIVHRKKGDLFRMEDRLTFGLAVAVKGRYIYRQGGREYPSDSDHVIFLPKSATYELECLEDDDSFVVNFACNLLTTELFSRETAGAEQLVDCCTGLENALRRRDGRGRLLALMELYRLLSLCQQQEHLPEMSRKRAIIAKSVSFMRESYGSAKLTNDKIAAVSNISAIYFRKLFTELYGVSPNRYLQELRLNKAKQLLRRKSLSMEEIATESGYSSVYYFSGCFRKAEGCSPTEYAGRYDVI